MSLIRLGLSVSARPLTYNGNAAAQQRAYLAGTMVEQHPPDLCGDQFPICRSAKTYANQGSMGNAIDTNGTS
jgi:hypothetical protein